MDSLIFHINALEEKKQVLRARRNLRITNEDVMDHMDDCSFKKNFRLNKQAFQYVLGEIESSINIGVKSSSITTKQKLGACLRFFAQGSYQQSVGNDLFCAMAQSTFSTILSQLLNIMEEKLCPKWINLKMDNEKKFEAKQYFFQKCGIPGVVMCLDGTHIKIQTPTENEHLFYNRKGFCSLNALIICDHEQKIRFIDARYQGANHDSHIYNLSSAKEQFMQEYINGERNTRLLGDSGYPLQPWLITPFRNAAPDSPESRFNKAHAKGRNIIERTIGLLKCRFRCLLGARALHYSPAKAAQIINVCAALHNICLHYKVTDEELFLEPTIIDPIATDATNNNTNIPTEYSEEAAGIRRRMLDSFR